MGRSIDHLSEPSIPGMQAPHTLNGADVHDLEYGSPEFLEHVLAAAQEAGNDFMVGAVSAFAVGSARDLQENLHGRVGEWRRYQEIARTVFGDI